MLKQLPTVGAGLRESSANWSDMGRPLAPTSHPLADILAVAYEFENGANLGLDSHSNHKDLANTNGVSQGTGLIDVGAASFVAASNQFLSIADDPLFKADNIINFVTWFNLTAGNRCLFSKSSGAGTTYIGYVTSGTASLLVRKADDSGYQEKDWSSAVSAGAWHMFAGYIDPIGLTIGISIDGGNWQTMAIVSAMLAAVPFNLGKYSTSTFPYDGRLDAFRIFRGSILQNAWLAWMYNGGAGRTLAEVLSYTG